MKTTYIINFILLTLFLSITSYANETCPNPNVITLETTKNVIVEQKGVFRYKVDKFNILPQGIQFKGAFSKIIIDVTGKQASFIEGCLNAGDADIYLLNPNGITVQNVQAKIPNNVYLSTAQQFFYHSQSFIFHDSPQPIEIKNTILDFHSDKTLALIGGDISHFNSNLILPDGNLLLIAAQSQGRVKIGQNYSYQFDKFANIHINRELSLAHDDIADIDLTGDGGGLAFIRAHNLVLDNGWVFSDTEKSLNGKGIDIEVENNVKIQHAGRITTDVLKKATGNGGNIKIIAKNKIILDGYTYEDYDYEEKMQGDESYNFSYMFSTFASNVFGMGDGGNIDIKAKQLIMKNRAAIQASLGSSETDYSTGNSGVVSIDIVENIELASYSQFNMFSVKYSKGDIGKLNITANRLKLKDSIIRMQAKGNGSGGKASIHVKQSIDILNTDKNLAWIQYTCQNLALNNTLLENTNTSKPQASILGFVKENAQKASDIEIRTKNLTLSEGGYIDTNSVSQEKVSGGEISIFADNLFLMGKTCPSRILSSAQGEGDGGNINLYIKNKLLIKQNSAIIANSFTPPLKNFKDYEKNAQWAFNPVENGKSGNIYIKGENIEGVKTYVEQVVIDDNSRITVESCNQKKAGKISLYSKNIILNQSNITARSRLTGGGIIDIFSKNKVILDNSEITASTSGLIQYSGGIINIQKPELILLNHSNITATAYEGKGGEIYTKMGLLLQSQKTSKISADSEKGIDGKVRIEQLNPNFIHHLITTSADFEPYQKILLNACDSQAPNKLTILDGELLTTHPFNNNIFQFNQIDNIQENPAQNNFNKKMLYEQTIRPFTVNNIEIVGKSRFFCQDRQYQDFLDKKRHEIYRKLISFLKLNIEVEDIYKRPADACQINEILDKQSFPQPFTLSTLLDIQEAIQAVYDDYYNKQHNDYKGQIYSTHTTVRIPNQDISDGIVEIHIFEEKLSNIEFITENGKLDIQPNYIRSLLTTSQPFRTQDLHQALQNLLDEEIIEKFEAHLKTGQFAHEKTLYLKLILNEQQKVSTNQQTTVLQNSLCRNDDYNKQLADNGQRLFRTLPVNRMGTHLAFLAKLEKNSFFDILSSQKQLFNFGLKQPIYTKRTSDNQLRSKQTMSFILQLEKQAIEIKVKDNTFNMLQGMENGLKRDFSYYFGQKWEKLLETGYSESILSAFQTSLRAKNAAKIYHYQVNKSWTPHINWKLDAQLANQYTDFLHYFSLNDIRGYAKDKFIQQNGFSSRFNINFPQNIEHSRFAIQLFFDVGSVWKTSANIVNQLWERKKQHLSQSFVIINKTNYSNTQYIEKLKQPLWHQSSAALLSHSLQTQWLETWEICKQIAKIWNHATDSNAEKWKKTNILKQEHPHQNQCDLTLLSSVGIQFNWHIWQRERQFLLTLW